MQVLPNRVVWHGPIRLWFHALRFHLIKWQRYAPKFHLHSAQRKFGKPSGESTRCTPTMPLHPSAVVTRDNADTGVPNMTAGNWSWLPTAIRKSMRKRRYLHTRKFREKSRRRTGNIHSWSKSSPTVSLLYLSNPFLPSLGREGLSENQQRRWMHDYYCVTFTIRQACITIDRMFVEPNQGFGMLGIVARDCLSIWKQANDKGMVLRPEFSKDTCSVQAWSLIEFISQNSCDQVDPALVLTVVLAYMMCYQQSWKVFVNSGEKIPAAWFNLAQSVCRRDAVHALEEGGKLLDELLTSENISSAIEIFDTVCKQFFALEQYISSSEAMGPLMKYTELKSPISKVAK